MNARRNDPHEVLESALRFRDATLSAIATLGILALGFENLAFGCVGALIVFVFMMVLK